MKTINYTTRTFYVPASKMDTLLEFQEKCRANGRKSYSEVLLELMQEYNGNNLILPSYSRYGRMASILLLHFITF